MARKLGYLKRLAALVAVGLVIAGGAWFSAAEARAEIWTVATSEEIGEGATLTLDKHKRDRVSLVAASKASNKLLRVYLDGKVEVLLSGLIAPESPVVLNAGEIAFISGAPDDRTVYLLAPKGDKAVAIFGPNAPNRHLLQADPESTAWAIDRPQVTHIVRGEGRALVIACRPASLKHREGSPGTLFLALLDFQNSWRFMPSAGGGRTDPLENRWWANTAPTALNIPKIAAIAALEGSGPALPSFIAIGEEFQHLWKNLYGLVHWQGGRFVRTVAVTQFEDGILVAANDEWEPQTIWKTALNSDHHPVYEQYLKSANFHGDGGQRDEVGGFEVTSMVTAPGGGMFVIDKKHPNTVKFLNWGENDRKLAEHVGSLIERINAADREPNDGVKIGRIRRLTHSVRTLQAVAERRALHAVSQDGKPTRTILVDDCQDTDCSIGDLPGEVLEQVNSYVDGGAATPVELQMIRMRARMALDVIAHHAPAVGSMLESAE